MASWHPYYRKRLPTRTYEQNADGDGVRIHLTPPPSAEGVDPVVAAVDSFDYRASAAISSSSGLAGGGAAGPPRIWPDIYSLSSNPTHPQEPWFVERDLLEFKWYDGKAPTIYLPRTKCLAALAYADYFPANVARGRGLRSMVSRAILASSPGWCGSFGPGVDGILSLDASEGNYDMTQMFLLPMAYRHFDDLSPAASDLLITQLLARGRAHRPRVDDTYTSGTNPGDWPRAGFVSPLGYHVDIGETENHILMITTARYLTNQLLHQRDPNPDYDNLRNGGNGHPSCTALVLTLLRRIINGDFSEYNAKSYQSESRWALLNLCSYAYDHEIRLGARMVLDYVSAHMAVSSSDLRRLLPFRRRNEGPNSAHTAQGFMSVGIRDWQDGSDPMSPYFAMQSGNLRAYAPTVKPDSFTINDSGGDLSIEVLSEYRLPPLIHELFVRDEHRRFFQRLHRTPRSEVGGNRNCDNMEIFAGSQSYLITAGGAPAQWAIDPGIAAIINGEKMAQQLGVAVTTSFMPTARLGINALDLIQFGEFSKQFRHQTHWKIAGQSIKGTNSVSMKGLANYGVAPDFCCGHQVWLPGWISAKVSFDRDGNPVEPRTKSGFCFVDMAVSDPVQRGRRAGFYLSLYQQSPGGLALLEAHDTWRTPELSFDEFRQGVLHRNANLQLQSNVGAVYTTTKLDVIEFVIWREGDRDPQAGSGALVLAVDFNNQSSADAIGRADLITGRLANGTVMNTFADAVIHITNPQRAGTLILDFAEEAHPRRHDTGTGEFEVAGFHNEVWLDFDYVGPGEGDVCRPFNTVEAASAGVADHGVIRIVPGATPHRGVIGRDKRFTMMAPAGGATIGGPVQFPLSRPSDTGSVSLRDVWVQFGWQANFIARPTDLFNSVLDAIRVVEDGGTVHIQPGSTRERGRLGNGKRCRLVAPIGGVSIGWSS